MAGASRIRDRGLEVVVEDPASGGFAFDLGVVIARLGGRVGAEQIVEGKSPGSVLGDQVGPGQLSHELTGFGVADSGEAGGGWGRYVGAGVQAEQPEQAR
jgi:hypothetical protein